MTDRELMQQALDALCDIIPANANREEIDRIQHTAIIALRERLAQPEQEPVAWMDRHGACMSAVFKEIDATGDEYTTPLYTAPQRREWVGLTADEIWKCNAAPKGSAVEYHICMAHQNLLDFAEAMEAKLREKNT